MVYHTIEPVFDKSSKILILGSFPSPKSRETGFYYGHPQNRLWKVLSAVLGEKTPVTNDEKKAFLLKNKIAMWDVVYSCEIVGASDSSIKNVTYSDLSVIFSVSQIVAVFTLGKTASDLYEKGNKNLTVEHMSLPSTSPANAVFSTEKLIEKYSVIKKYL